jgi:hypothetical protein
LVDERADKPISDSACGVWQRQDRGSVLQRELLDAIASFIALSTKVSDQPAGDSPRASLVIFRSGASG